MPDPQKKMWFAPKTFGYGAGLPISWEGWALIAGLLAWIIGLQVLSRLYLQGQERTLARAAGVLAIVPFILVARARTEGGWRWRNGRE